MPVDVLPAEASTQGLVRELITRSETENARVLCPEPHVTGRLTEPPVIPRFLAALHAAGASTERVGVYAVQQGASPADVGPETDMLRRGLVHAVVFSSQAEAQVRRWGTECESDCVRCLAARVIRAVRRDWCKHWEGSRPHEICCVRAGLCWRRMAPTLLRAWRLGSACPWRWLGSTLELSMVSWTPSNRTSLRAARDTATKSQP